DEVREAALLRPRQGEPVRARLLQPQEGRRRPRVPGRRRRRLRVPMLMTRSRSGRGRKTLPAALLVAGCSAPQVIDAGYDDAGVDAGHDAGTDAGYDAGYDAGTDAGLDCTERIVDGGQKCGCITQYNPNTMMLEPVPYCDPDVGNPCPLGC